MCSKNSRLSKCKSDVSPSSPPLKVMNADLESELQDKFPSSPNKIFSRESEDDFDKSNLKWWEYPTSEEKKSMPAKTKLLKMALFRRSSTIKQEKLQTLIQKNSNIPSSKHEFSSNGSIFNHDDSEAKKD